MTQSLLDLAAVNDAFRDLAEHKGWQAYHTPKNLAAAVAVEAAELLEIFQWLSDEQAHALKHNLSAKSKVADEAADVIMYVIELCQRMDIDVVEAVSHKIEKNRVKHNGLAC